MDNIKEEIALRWNESSTNYDKQYSHGMKSKAEEIQWKKFLKQVVGEEKKYILDVGSGTGFLSILLGELGHICEGIDISEGMMAVAKEKAKEKGLDIKFTFGDAENLSMKDNTYDVIINRHILWTLPNPEKAIKEWKRVLKPGGKLIIIDGDWFYKRTVTDKLKISLGKFLISITESQDGHKGTYSKDVQEKLPMMKDENARNLHKLVKDVGLKDIKIVHMNEVDGIEKENMPFKHRLVNVYKRICITSKK